MSVTFFYSEEAWWIGTKKINRWYKLRHSFEVHQQYIRYIWNARCWLTWKSRVLAETWTNTMFEMLLIKIPLDSCLDYWSVIPKIRQWCIFVSQVHSGIYLFKFKRKLNPNLKRDYQFLSKEMWKPIGLITRERFLKPVLKLDFTAHGIMESLSEFGLCGLLEWGGTFLLRCGIGTVCINIQQQAASDT